MKKRYVVKAHFPPGSHGGNVKAQYLPIGSLFIDASAFPPKISLKLDLVPVGDGWSGWCNAFDPEEKPSTPAKPRAYSMDNPPPPVDDDIPF